jgi:hypothetical protein
LKKIKGKKKNCTEYTHTRIFYPFFFINNTDSPPLYFFFMTLTFILLNPGTILNELFFSITDFIFIFTHSFRLDSETAHVLSFLLSILPFKFLRFFYIYFLTIFFFRNQSIFQNRWNDLISFPKPPPSIRMDNFLRTPFFFFKFISPNIFFYHHIVIKCCHVWLSF